MATFTLVVIVAWLGSFCATFVAQECATLPEVGNGIQGSSLLQAKRKYSNGPLYPQWPIAGGHVASEFRFVHEIDQPCGFEKECPREYSITSVENIIATPDDANKLETLHNESRTACTQGQATILDKGGWCYKEAFSMRVSKNDSNIDMDFLLPERHFVADEVTVKVLAEKVLLRANGSCCYSLTDLGAGVGQLGHSLKAKIPQLEYYGYDGSGNVEEFTNGYVRFADLTLPLQLNRTDWLISSEVGEHIPSVYEAQVIANMHAHNCRGVILTWAVVGQSGHGHVNCHSNEYLINLFEGLGYKKNDELTLALRVPRTGPFPSWWLSNSSLAFERVNRPSGC